MLDSPIDNFARLCTIAKVQRSEGYSASPRIQDFRTTFAVHRITAWINAGADLNRLLPALAAYMGRRSLLSGESYLRLTPERFRKQLNSLSPGGALELS
jgi:integrase/recombinase XerD